MKTKTINIYTFDELSEEAKSKRRLCINAKNYRKIKLEKYADKLALGIYKRVNKKD